MNNYATTFIYVVFKCSVVYCFMILGPSLGKRIVGEKSIRVHKAMNGNRQLLLPTLAGFCVLYSHAGAK